MAKKIKKKIHTHTNTQLTTLLAMSREMGDWPTKHGAGCGAWAWSQKQSRSQALVSAQELLLLQQLPINVLVRHWAVKLA